MGRASASLVSLLVVVATAAAAGEPELRGQRVESVRIEGASLSPEDARAYLEVHPGDRFSPQAVRRTVKLLYHLGQFGQVRAFARPEADGLAVVFELVPKHRVLVVEMLGCDALSEDSLRRLSRLERGAEFDHWQMEASVEDMLALYARRGYRRARIIAKADPTRRGDVRVRFFIQEGPPTRISRLWFRGQAQFSFGRLGEVVGLGRGDVVDAEQIGRAVERLRRFYLDQGYLEATVSGPRIDSQLEAMWEVVPFDVRAGSRVTFRIAGNEVIPTRSLLAELKLEAPQALTPYALQDLADKLAARYRRYGYAKVRVEPTVHQQPARALKEVVFQIHEGPRVQVRDLRFEGAAGFTQQELREVVSEAMQEAVPQPLLGQPVDRGDVDEFSGGYPLRGRVRRTNRPQGTWFELDPETMYLREPYEKALSTIEDLYHSRGYLEARVDTPLLSYDDSGTNLYISVPISAGRQTLVESITFEGNQSLSSEELLKTAEGLARGVRPGGPLDQFGVEELRRELVRVYARRGFIYSRIDTAVRFSDDRSLAEVQYVLREGPKVRVRRILLRGDVLTDRKVIDRMLSLRPGSLLSPERLQASQEDLMELGIFSGVDIKLLDPEVSEEEKDLVIQVRERLPHALSISPGLSSGEGVRLALEHTRRNLFGYALELVNKVKLNYQVFYPLPLLPESLRHRYEDMSFFEGLEGWLVSGLHWPRAWWLDPDLALRLDLLLLQDHAISYDLRKLSFTPGLDWKPTEDLTLGAEVELEYNGLTCPFDSAEAACPDPTGMRCGAARRHLVVQACGGATGQRWLRYDEGNLLLLSFRPELSWDRRDNPFNPHRGLLVHLRTELAGSLFPDRPVLFAKLDGLLSGYLPLGRSATLALSIRAGAIMHLLDESRTPSHKLFFLGGRNSVRGFQEETLIPADLDPPCILTERSTSRRFCVSPGGNAYLVLKGELRFPLVPGTVDGALFVDAGNLWLEPANFRPFDLRPVAGVGVRLVTPIGPVAFDLGVNLDPDESRGESVWNLHFNIGVF